MNFLCSIRTNARTSPLARDTSGLTRRQDDFKYMELNSLMIGEQTEIEHSGSLFR